MAEVIIRHRDAEVRTDLTNLTVNWDAEAQVWARVMRNRVRWVTTPEALGEIYRLSAEQLQNWGFPLPALRAMRGVDALEIEFPADHAQIGSICALPWELMLSAAITGRPGLADAPLVFRYVRREKRAKPPSAPAKIPLLFVQSAPGRIARRYQFDDEFNLVREALPETKWNVQQLKDPAITEIASRAAELDPLFVHLTGADVQQGSEILKREPPSPGTSGAYLKSPAGEPVAHSSTDIAAAILEPDRHPACVAVNMYYSSEIAAALVHRGADAAIGFLAEFDDATAEVFFSNFYRAVAEVPDAAAIVPFRRALASLLRDPATAKHVEGAPIVMWTTTSVVDLHEEKRRAKAARRTSEEPSLTHAQVRGLLQPYIDFPPAINYCGLHNGHSVFAEPAKLGIRNPEQRSIQGVSVDVILNVAGERSVYSRTLDIDRTNHPIESVCLSLTSEMVRALRERIQANLTVEFTYEGRPLMRETRQVGLLATDEWDNQSPWLPSFVLPRDPAVANIVRWAQPILNSIADASDVGFDNYLRLTGAADKREAERKIVDQQVRALWWAVRHRCRLSYLAAAPVYTANAQRIRTPSAVLNGRAGTCLDLALLLTACLAAIDLHAVVFVFRDHAMPGYLRSPAGHEELARCMSSYYPEPGQQRSTVPRTPWILGSDCFESVLLMIRSDELVPLETVTLTERAGFANAIDRGKDRLQRAGGGDFVGLYDLTLARRHGVTPLPIAGLI